MSPPKRKRGLSVLGILGDKDRAGAVEVYRITMPFTYLNNQGSAQCSWITRDVSVQLLSAYDVDAVFDYDVIVLHHTISDVADAGESLVEALRRRGARIVYEVDDDYSGTYRDTSDGMTWKPYLPYVDAVTVTTRHLAERIRPDSGRKPVYVLPNAVDCGWFGQRAQAVERIFPDYLTIMLAGTKTHHDDWIVLQDVIPNILTDYPGVKFLIAGYVPDYLQDTGAETIAPVPYAAYPGVLAQADILCAPLVPDDPFNRCKSPIKAIEGWCAARPVGKHLGGCAVIATDCVVYRGTVQNRHNGLLVKHTPEAWEHALRDLIENELPRRKLQVEGLKDARRYDMAVHWKNWYRTYNEIAHGGVI